MRTIFLRLVALAMFFALATGSAQAALFSLNQDGLTADGSSSTNGTAISNGTAFSVHAIFSGTPIGAMPGGAAYQASAVNFTVGGQSYAVTADSISNYTVILYDPSFPLFPAGESLNAAGIANTVTNDGFGPFYGTATPALVANSPAPTVFSNYSGNFANSLTLTTAGGNLTLAYDNSVGINSTIAAVPEPEEWAMMLVGSGLISWQIRRRAKTAA
jgi:hypothetical protein